ncbi:hypothetical protein EVAR_64579_1 [Eumeta japonica]|uniref:Uncharacterized protein n=1 Tax=Eumeta variegata TaxID=151549 RepID=A0A4C1ZLL6_EUMVA|nr:hypothetical protein EVAR_64579_1 [Eumeta japonica]
MLAVVCLLLFIPKLIHFKKSGNNNNNDDEGDERSFGIRTKNAVELSSIQQVLDRAISVYGAQAPDCGVVCRLRHVIDDIAEFEPYYRHRSTLNLQNVVDLKIFGIHFPLSVLVGTADVGVRGARHDTTMNLAEALVTPTMSNNALVLHQRYDLQLITISYSMEENGTLYDGFARSRIFKVHAKREVLVQFIILVQARAAGARSGLERPLTAQSALTRHTRALSGFT